MARTVWGAHKRYMDTYLNVYKGVYVGYSLIHFFHSTLYGYFEWQKLISTIDSSLETAQVEIMKDTTGSEVALTT